LPFAVLRGYAGSDLPRYSDRIKPIRCPFTGLELTAVPALRPDVTVIHAQQADRKGNVLVRGIVGVQKEAVLAARRAIATVEEVVDALDADFNACVLPHWVFAAVAVARGERSLPTRTATTSATIASIRNGTRLRARARAFSSGSHAM
jgi:glutaconate CoA-transferase subunit A